MENPQLFSSIIGAIIALVIYWLVRRDHLAPKQAVRWVLVALTIFVLGAFPGLIDKFGHAMGIAYPPVIPLILGICAALLKILLMDIERNKMNITQSRLVQKLAILEAEVDELRYLVDKSSNA
ncbi:DUF2304 domain-containing protein [Thalassotalea montiporae]